MENVVFLLVMIHQDMYTTRAVDIYHVIHMIEDAVLLSVLTLFFYHITAYDDHSLC